MLQYTTRIGLRVQGHRSLGCTEASTWTADLGDKLSRSASCTLVILSPAASPVSRQSAKCMDMNKMPGSTSEPEATPAEVLEGTSIVDPAPVPPAESRVPPEMPE